VVCAICIPIIGVYGAVVGALAAEATLAVGYGFLIRKRLPHARFPIVTAAVTCIAAAAACSSVLLGLPPVVVPVVGCAAFAVVLLVAKEIPAEVLSGVGRTLYQARRMVGGGSAA
jgi:hypothetical protein